MINMKKFAILIQVELDDMYNEQMILDMYQNIIGFLGIKSVEVKEID